jgi:hypothetical protein
MKLNKDLREFIALLNSTGVRYLIVGGYAVGFHGYPRFTGDIDFFVERSLENATRLEKVLSDFGFGGLGLSAGNFLEPESVIQLGRPPHRIDILTSIDAINFGEAWPNRANAELDGISTAFISKKDLVKNKRATARPQDIADLDKLELS